MIEKTILEIKQIVYRECWQYLCAGRLPSILYSWIDKELSPIHVLQLQETCLPQISNVCGKTLLLK